MTSLWLGEGGYSLILIFGAVFITIIVEFGMGSEMLLEEFVEIQKEVSRLRDEVEAVKDRMDKNRMPTEE